MQAIDVQTVVFREGEHFVAQCLDVDVSSFGANEEEALANLREALELLSRITKIPHLRSRNFPTPCGSLP